MTNVMAVLALSFGCGIFLASIIAPPVEVVLVSGVLLFLFFVAALAKGKRVTTVLVLLWIVLGGLRYQILWQQPSLLEEFRGEQVIATGIILAEPTQREDKLSFPLVVEEIQRAGVVSQYRERVVVEVPASGTNLSYGQRVMIKARVVVPLDPANFQGFSYRTHLRRQGVAVILSSGSLESVVVVQDRAGGSLFVQGGLWLRGRVQDVIAKAGDPQTTAVLPAMLLGDGQTLGAELLDDIRRAGVMHLFAVSGLHVGFVVGLSYALGKWLSWSPKATAVVGGIFTLIYLAMVGLGPSVLRASTMMWVGVIGLLYAKKVNGLAAWGFAGLGLLLVSPGLLFSPGFQLSFVATWGILYLLPPLLEYLIPLPRWLALSIGVSLVAQIATWPVLAYHFQGVAILTVVVNLVAVPVAGVLVGLGLLGGLAGMVLLPLGQGVLWLARPLVAFFVWLAGVVASLPMAFVPLRAPSLPFIACYYLLLAFLPVLFRKAGDITTHRKANREPTILGFALGKRFVPVLAVALVFFLVFTWMWPLGSGQPLTVTFLSVGAGDGAVIQIKGGKTLLVDVGPGGWEGRFDAGAQVVVPFLERQGIEQVDLVLLTHPHRDHYGGLPAVLEELEVEAIVIPRGFQPQEFGLENTGTIPLYWAQAGDKLTLAQGVELTFRHPQEQLMKGTRDDANNNSLVMSLALGNVVYLFTGDLEWEGESLLLQARSIPRASVLKVGHHGANNASSADFLRAVNPEIAVISTGPNNYGHPHRETIDRLEAVGTRIYRTDKQGAVRVSTDGRRIWVRTARTSELVPEAIPRAG